MHNLLNNVAKPLVVALAALALAHCHMACKSTGSLPVDLVYSGQLADCVNNAKTLDDSHVCRGKVNWQHGLCPASDPRMYCDLVPDGG